MKVGKYFVLLLALLIITAGAAWYLRNSLIERFSGPLLAQYGLTITDISLRTIAGDGASISYLALKHTNGTEIAIENLRLPIGVKQAAIKSYSADRVVIKTVEKNEEAPFETAFWIDRLLAFPEVLADSEIAIGQFELDRQDPVHDINWLLSDGKQVLTATVVEVRAALAVTPGGVDSHKLIITLANSSVEAELHRRQDEFSLSGIAAIRVAEWLPYVSLAGLTPEELPLRSGGFNANFVVSLPNDPAAPLAANVSLAIIEPLRVRIDGDGESIGLTIGADSAPLQLATTLPDGDWHVTQDHASLLLAYAEWEALPVALSGIRCEPGIRCTFSSELKADKVPSPLGSIGRLEIRSSQTAVVDAGRTTLTVSPNATLAIQKLSGDSAEFALLNATANSGMNIEIFTTGWKTEIASLDLQVDQWVAGENVTLTTPVFVENLVVSSDQDRLTGVMGVFSPSTKVALEGQIITAPGVKGRVDLKGSAITAALSTTGIQREGEIALKHDLDTSQGSLRLRHAGISLNTKGLAERMTPWPYNWSLNAGKIDLDMDASWDKSGSTTGIRADATAELSELAGYYTDIAFVGFSSKVSGRYNTVDGVQLAPSTLTAALVDIGFPLHNIRADYALQVEPLLAEVTSLTLDAFGGRIRADPFSYHTAGERNTVTLRAESLELKELLSVQEMKAVNVSGTISAVLPITIEGDTVTVASGHMTGEAPGGVIQYLGGNVDATAEGSGVGLVTKALSNFKYEALTSDISYSPEGDLKLQMKLTGRNPDMSETRPVILNLGVESNIPQMLKSLQAARTVEDILEKRLQQ